LSQGDFYYPDSFTYLTPALNMLHGLGFSTDGQPETLRTPGYPLFLFPFLALRAPAGVIVATQHLLDALLAVAIYLLTRRNFAAALILGLDTITIHYANKILTETLSAVLIVVIFVILIRSRSLPALIVTGLLCGALVLVRPVAIVYFCVVMLWLGYVRVRLAAIMVFIAAAVVLPLAWSARNAARTGVFTISSIGSNNLLMHRAAGALAMEDGGDFKTHLEARQHQLQRIVDAMIEEGEGVDDPDDLNSADLAPYYSALARQILLQHPRALMLLTLRGFAVNMFDTDWDALAEVVDDELIPEEATKIAVHVWTWLLWIVTLAGIVAMWRRDRPQAALIAATIFYFLFMAAGGEAEHRFRVPIVPLMALASASVLSPRRVRGAVSGDKVVQCSERTLEPTRSITTLQRCRSLNGLPCDVPRPRHRPATTAVAPLMDTARLSLTPNVIV
jgi:hypothetical protein